MKLHRLELEGFGPFLERQVVDFDAFADDGIFLIAGRTGAGKSSVLDGVCYGLYGGVPRYDGAERRLRSDHCAPDDPTQVVVEFSADGERWRVTRSPEYERPKLRGGGTTKEPHRALLEVHRPDGWTGVAARPVDVASRLDEILGLNQQQFLQVILLAQNRFARFLLAKNDERQGLLRTLFGTRSFDQYAEALDARRKRAHDLLTGEGAEVSTLLDEAERLVAELGRDDTGRDDASERSTDAEEQPTATDEAPGATAAPRTMGERLAFVVAGVQRAEYRVDVLSRERGLAASALDDALRDERETIALHERQRDRLRARHALAALTAAGDEVSRRRAEAAAAAAAEELRAPVEAAARAAVRATDAETREAAAREHLRAVGEADGDAEELARRADELTGLLARGHEARAVEDQLAAVDREIEAGRLVVTRLESAQTDVDGRRAALPAERAQLDERLAALAGADARHAAAQALLDETDTRLESAREAERLLELRDQTDLTALVRADELQRAIDAWASALRRRLDGAAAELARSLVDGEPCAVCGAREHPTPALGDHEPVTDAEIAAAEERKDRAADEDRLASDASRVARDAYALAVARAGGESVAALSERRADTAEAVAAAAADRAELERSRADRAVLAETEAAVALEAERIARELAAARQDLALARQRADGLRAELGEARAEFPTVAARLDDLRARRDAVRDLVAARAEADACRDAARAADTDLAARLADGPFADVAAVTHALRDADTRRRLDTAIADHDAAVSSARQRLLELELALADAPDDPVDLAPAAAAVVSARHVVESAAAAHAAAAATAARLRDLTERADAGHAAVARLADEHAVIARLADTVAGRAPNTRRMTLETFVLAAELEEIVAAANLRLDQMSSGRYRLQHTDALAARGAASGLGLEIVDAFTGQSRPPQSLSGGETFLASLALALGLAEVVTARAGGIRLDTLFIDEGFGSLDDETLDLAMRALDELRQGGRTVGVISHVASMRDQLLAQLRVTATPRGPSIIRQDAAIPVV